MRFNDRPDPTALLRKAEAVRNGTAPAQGLQKVPTPCRSVCTMNRRSGWCEGCYRTLQEITDWTTLGDDQKRQVWRLIAQRVKGPHP
jgi:predicted Fe-S protein YdhL (DUF1289 family)